MQNAYFKHIFEEGFKLERGELVEVTNREHYSVQEFKQITNFENTKKVLEDITLDLPSTPNIKDIRKVMLNRDEKIEKENNYLKKVIDRFKITVQKFITWVCHKFSYPSEDDLIRIFEKETCTNFNIEKQLDINKFEKEEKEDKLEY